MMTLFDSIVSDLGKLPPSKLVKVSNYIHTLHPSDVDTSRRQAAIRATAGCLTESEGEDFERAVRELSDRIDSDE